MGELHLEPLPDTDEPEKTETPLTAKWRLQVLEFEKMLGEPNIENPQIRSIVSYFSLFGFDHPELQDKYRPLIKDYYEKIRVLAKEKFEQEPKSFASFDRYLKTLYELHQLQERIFDEYVEVDLFTEIQKAEKALSDYLAKHPKLAKEIATEEMENTLSIESTEPLVKDRIEEDLEVLQLAFPGIKRVKQQKGPDKFIADFNGEEWEFKVQNAPLFDTTTIVVISKENPEMLFTMEIGELIKELEEGRFKDLIEKSRRDYEQEKQYSETLQSFDLPHDQNISYFRIFPNEYDEVIGNSLSGSTLLGHTLHQSYENLEVKTPIFTPTPKTAILQAIEEDYQKGVRYFYLDFYAHGAETHLAFPQALEPSDLTEIFQKYKDAKFVISTMACYGGGLREGILSILETHPEFKEQIAAFLQSKPDTPNIVGPRLIDATKKIKMSNIKQAFGSTYQIYLIDGLQKGMTYGEAVYYADMETKKKTYVDAEAILNGQLITKSEKHPTSIET